MHHCAACFVSRKQIFVLCCLLVSLRFVQIPHLLRLCFALSFFPTNITTTCTTFSHKGLGFFLALHTEYKNVKPAVLGMLPKETVLLKILFLPKYFQSIWRGVKPQGLSVVFPFTISSGTPSTALSNWIVLQKKKKKKRLHKTVCRFKNYPSGACGDEYRAHSCQT